MCQETDRIYTVHDDAHDDPLPRRHSRTVLHLSFPEFGIATRYVSNVHSDSMQRASQQDLVFVVGCHGNDELDG